MEREELIKRLKDIEWDDFEVKEARNELPKNIWETVSAFSNTSGGWIVLGIRQKGNSFSIHGVGNAEKLEQDFLGTLRSQKFNIRLSPIARQYMIDGKKVFCFGGGYSLDKDYRVPGRTWWPQDLPESAKSNWHTPSAWQSLYP